ncbi:hypothetical protein MPH_13897 [Macrophomina phaseolina MS6]|uniref:ThiJ/PfpI n=1 Tax=Macrophomina phaseolina (strain MS6) TaxID=1126212 RepID=K2RG97_MACPH|nr:hypothetical protein MPH_13897 [Macrophomina phaseolina MS6]
MMIYSDNIRIGVLVLPGAQLLDTASIDIFGTASRQYFESIAAVPRPIVQKAPNVSIIYISNVTAGDSIPVTSAMKLHCDHHFSEPSVKPGELDILLVPGNDPDRQADDNLSAWLAAHGKDQTTDILSVCTGLYLCGWARLLKGRKVCGPRPQQLDLKQKFADQNATFLGHELRWVQDGNFWSSGSYCAFSYNRSKANYLNNFFFKGSISNGIDLVAAYLRSSGKWPKEVAEFAIQFAEVGDRPQSYGRD